MSQNLSLPKPILERAVAALSLAKAVSHPRIQPIIQDSLKELKDALKADNS